MPCEQRRLAATCHVSYIPMLSVTLQIWSRRRLRFIGVTGSATSSESAPLRTSAAKAARAKNAVLACLRGGPWLPHAATGSAISSAFWRLQRSHGASLQNQQYSEILLNQTCPARSTGASQGAKTIQNARVETRDAGAAARAGSL